MSRFPQTVLASLIAVAAASGCAVEGAQTEGSIDVTLDDGGGKADGLSGRQLRIKIQGEVAHFGPGETESSVRVASATDQSLSIVGRLHALDLEFETEPFVIEASNDGLTPTDMMMMLVFEYYDEEEGIYRWISVPGTDRMDTLSMSAYEIITDGQLAMKDYPTQLRYGVLVFPNWSLLDLEMDDEFDYELLIDGPAPADLDY